MIRPVTTTGLAFLVALLLAACGEDIFEADAPEINATSAYQPDGTLDQIIERDTLRAITAYSATSYFIYKGQPMGFEYELLQRLAGHLGVELEIVVARNFDEIFEKLRRGEGDLIAYNMTVTRGRLQEVAFTDPVGTTNQVLVQRKPEEWQVMSRRAVEKKLIRSPLDLIDQQVHVRRNSSYRKRLENLADEIGGDIDIQLVDGTLTTGDLIRMVSDGEIDYTVSDRNIALINQSYLPEVDIETSLSLPQRLAWAVRTNSPELLRVVNEWLAEEQDQATFYVIYNKYFKDKRGFRRRIASKYYSRAGGNISRYDSLVQRYAGQIGWDWRLLSSLIYQESRFQPQARSWAGAAGLMQMTAPTAREFGARDRYDPEESLRAGTRYLAFLEKFWAEVPDSTERRKFVLASYNVGQGHVSDARRLAEKYGRDPNRWEGHVADYLLLKSKPKYYHDPVVRFGYCRGGEPFAYVREISERFGQYRELFKGRQEEATADERPAETTIES